MSEETRQASRSAAIGMVMSVVASVFFGFILLVAITFAVPDVQGTLDAGADAVVYIWTESMGNAWAEFLLFIAVVAQFFCGTASVTSASRMMFAFSRDRAVPGSRVWRKVARNRVPVNAVIAIGVLAWLIMVPSLYSVVAYLVATSIAVIGLNIAFALPIILRIRAGERFERGGVEPRQALQVDQPAGRRLDRVHLHRRHPARLPERQSRAPRSSTGLSSTTARSRWAPR